MLWKDGYELNFNCNLCICDINSINENIRFIIEVEVKMENIEYLRDQLLHVTKLIMDLTEVKKENELALTCLKKTESETLKMLERYNRETCDMH